MSAAQQVRYEQEQLEPVMSHYIHGTAAEEQQRLSQLNQILNDASLGEMRLCGGERILDVGSGLGQLTRAMARAARLSGAVIGIERDETQIVEAKRQALEAGEETLVEWRAGDAFALPLGKDEWGSFDVVHTRFLLEHVPDPLAVVKGMVRAARPGGRIILEDDCHDVLRLYPEPPGLPALWKAYLRTYDRLGNDPLIGHRLVSLLHEAGAVPRRNTWIFFGSCAGDPSLESHVLNLIGILEGARAVMVEQSLITEEYFDQGIQALHEWAGRPDAAIWFAMAWAEGIRDPEK